MVLFFSSNSRTKIGCKYNKLNTMCFECWSWTSRFYIGRFVMVMQAVLTSFPEALKSLEVDISSLLFVLKGLKPVTNVMKLTAAFRVRCGESVTRLRF